MHALVANHHFSQMDTATVCVVFSFIYQGFIEKCKERDSESIGTGLPIIVSDNQQCVCQSPEDLDER